MRGLLGGILAQALGLGKLFGDYELALADAQQRVTSPHLKFE